MAVGLDECCRSLAKEIFSVFYSILKCAAQLHMEGYWKLHKYSDISVAILGISNLFVVKPSLRKLAMLGPQRTQESHVDLLM